jgi:molybdate transport system substrate-binding protein
MQAPCKALAVLFLFSLFVGCASKEQAPIVGAASSLRHVMPALIHGFGKDLAVTYGGSGTLRRQVEGGAPIDMVLLASANPIDALIEKKLADPATRRRVASNRLVLISSEERPQITFKTLADLAEEDRIAIGDPGAVPAGQYAKQALEALGTWDSLQSRIVYAGDVAAVLGYARRREVSAAAVYETDVRGIEDVQIVDTADWSGAPRPEIVGVATSESPEARDFLKFVGSDAGAKVLSQFGFGPK